MGRFQRDDTVCRQKGQIELVSNPVLLDTTSYARNRAYNRVYGACSQDPGRKRLRLGTSVGWSDLYPSDYDRQWVSVAGLRGCYAFVMRVDPLNLLYESNEHNNRSVRIVRLPYRAGPQHC